MRNILFFLTLCLSFFFCTASKAEKIDCEMYCPMTNISEEELVKKLSSMPEEHWFECGSKLNSNTIPAVLEKLGVDAEFFQKRRWFCRGFLYDLDSKTKATRKAEQCKTIEAALRPELKKEKKSPKFEAGWMLYKQKNCEVSKEFEEYFMKDVFGL